MLKLIFSLLFITLGTLVFAQNAKEVEVSVNGEMEKIPLGRKSIFITAKGDTIEYSIDDILKEMMKNQPKKNDSLQMVQKKNAGESDSLITQKSADDKVTEIKVEVPNKEVEQKEKLEREEKLANEKIAAEKAAREKAQSENETLKQKMLEEQRVKQEKEVTKIDTIGEAKKEVEKKYLQWVDSLEQAEGKNEELKTISGKVTYTRELYPKGNNEIELVEEARDTSRIETVENKELLPDEAKVVEPVIEKTAVKIKAAEAVVEVEENKNIEIQKLKYDFKKYVLPDPLVTADNIGLMDTLKFINNGTKGSTVFPSMELGSANNFSLCYDYTVCNYHGYDEETIARQTTRYKVCLSGTMNDKNKVAEVYIDTKTGRKKIYYTVALLDDKNLTLIKK